MTVSLENKIASGFAVAALVMLLITAAAVWNTVRFDETFERVNHTHDVLAQLEKLLIGVIGMQSQTRGYALSGREETLQPFDETRTRLTGTRQNLRTLTADNPDQQRALNQLEALITEATEHMLQRIAARRAKGSDSLWETSASLRSEDTVDRVRHLVGEMQQRERNLFEERVEKTRRAVRLTIELAIVGSVCTLVFLVGSGLMVRRGFRARQAAEDALRQSDEHVRQMLDSIKDYAILMLNPDGRILSWNSGAERIMGYRADEIIGRTFVDFYPEAAVREGAPQRELREAAAAGRFEEEGWRVRKDGSTFWASVIVTVVRDRQHHLIGFAKITRDLTQRRQAEERIRTLNTDLQLQNARLEIANKELEAFSYSVSHDLRAPLRHIDGFASLLSQHAGSTLDDRSRRFISVITDSALRMGRLIDDLLTFSRMGRIQMELGDIDHDQLLAAVIREGGWDRESRITWRIEPLPRVQADAAMLRQVWLNLVGNAVKYSSKTPEPRLEIGSQKQEDSSTEQVFYVRDNGVGFDMKYAAKLFGVFQRLHSEAEFEGTGIGLANVRRIITRHGGRTWAESTLNAGATFYFSLPIISAPTPPLPRASV